MTGHRLDDEGGSERHGHPPQDHDEQPEQYGVNWAKVMLIALGVVLALGLLVFRVVWYECRLQVDPGEFAVLIQKTGANLDKEMVLAPTPDFRGAQLEVVKPGRYFKNPYYWDWKILKATNIETGRVGIVTRLYGQELPAAESIAREGEKDAADHPILYKGILADVLEPGRHYINTEAYNVEIADTVTIGAGFRGVVVRLVGKDPEDPNKFTVKEGERGVMPDLLEPGTHPEYANKYLYRIIPVDVRSQKFEMIGEDIIKFPAKDSFDVSMRGATEWMPDISRLAELVVKYVEEEDLEKTGGLGNVQKKIILPFARSYCRIVGGKHNSVDYILGTAKVIVQNEVEQQLKDACFKEGVIVRSFVIEAADPPDKIRQQYQRRELARREMDQFKKEIETAIGTVVMVGGVPTTGPDGKPRLDEYGSPVLTGGQPKLDAEGQPLRVGGKLTKVVQERRKDRETQLGQIRQGVVKDIRGAEQYAAVEVTKAAQEMEVAKINLEAAKDNAAATKAEGLARAAVAVMEATAKAEGVKAKIAAFGSGDKYAENILATKLAPAIRAILSNTEGPFTRMFERFATTQSEAKSAESKK